MDLLDLLAHLLADARQEQAALRADGPRRGHRHRRGHDDGVDRAEVPASWCRISSRPSAPTSSSCCRPAARAAASAQGTVTTLTEADAHAIADGVPVVLAVSPFIGTSGQVIGGNVNWQPDQMLGVGPDYPVVRNWPMASGEFFGERDISGVGQGVRPRPYGGPPAVPGHRSDRAAGARQEHPVHASSACWPGKGANLVGQDQDNILLMPYTTVRKRLQSSAFTNVDLVFVSARSEALSPQAEQEIRALLTERHRIPPGEKPDFEVRNTAEVAKRAERHHGVADGDALRASRPSRSWSAAWGS